MNLLGVLFVFVIKMNVIRGYCMRSLCKTRFRGSPLTKIYRPFTFAAAAPPIQYDYFAVDDKSRSIQYGDYSIIASQSHADRKFVDAEVIGTEKGPQVGETVWIRARVANACHFKEKSNPEESKNLMSFVAGIPDESIVDVMGEVAKADVKSCTQHNVELYIKKVFVVSRAPSMLPFQLNDAARSEKEIEASAGSESPFSGVSQDVRLNNRWLDLRTPANNAIMRIKSGVSMLFRESLLNKGFVEINTPKLISGSSEGGAEVFRTDYFGQVSCCLYYGDHRKCVNQAACLAQSPQLYKQMAISADLNRVFEIGPVFRAEKSMTRRHLCEFTGLDFEMAINEHYDEALTVIHEMFRHIFEGLESRFSKELAVIRSQYPSEPVRFTEKPLIIHWPEAMDMLQRAGHTVDPLEDLNTALELQLGALVKEKYGADFFALDQYPSNIRPFYTMPNATNPVYSNSYDLFIRGQEICSGAQRCHEAELLEHRIKAKGLDIEPLQSYVDSFRHGVYPHAGGGIGLERVVFLYLGLDNVRKASMFPRDPHRITP